MLKCQWTHLAKVSVLIYGLMKSNSGPKILQSITAVCLLPSAFRLLSHGSSAERSYSNGRLCSLALTLKIHGVLRRGPSSSGIPGDVAIRLRKRRTNERPPSYRVVGLRRTSPQTPVAIDKGRPVTVSRMNEVKCVLFLYRLWR
ncbi:Hypothetical protein SMAX5B_008663 [Scophthalmus maximus]|uniref:Uncharacterized protein n=1 Tax=Scophthalmus maximus TaxID=52904 RepID=A0A2U9CDD5_SCOMX|nr:Hypothetical protein SMAX5B_008663 [Scophthalmus maximus]